MAKDIGIESLSCIHYEDIQYDKELTANDIEELIDDPNHYFLNYEELLRGFYRDGLLPEELLQEYELDYLSYGGYDATDYTYDFPSEQVENRTALASHIKKLCKTPVRIITVEEMCKVQKIKTYDDRVYPYDRSYSRNIILNTYSPEGSRDLCFCQMCLKPKPKVYIEVNSIDILPEFFFSQLRLSLCLECSKRFEALRRNESIRKAFIRCIKEYVITDEGTVEIPIGNFDSITFTAKHLAEIQEIFRQIPPKHK